MRFADTESIGIKRELGSSEVFPVAADDGQMFWVGCIHGRNKYWEGKMFVECRTDDKRVNKDANFRY